MVQLLHVAAFYFRLTGNILFDLFLYVHINVKLRVAYFGFSSR
jgi:hypothetical protein